MFDVERPLLFHDFQVEILASGVSLVGDKDLVKLDLATIICTILLVPIVWTLEYMDYGLTVVN